jgi:hypothetical protein
MPDVVVERAEREEANRIAKEAVRGALIAAALAVPAPVESVEEVVVAQTAPTWILADE